MMEFMKNIEEELSENSASSRGNKFQTWDGKYKRNAAFFLHLGGGAYNISP
jgi:hypothetical protein